MYRLSIRKAPNFLTRARSTLTQTKLSDKAIFNGEDQTPLKEKQAPNRKDTWAPSQQPRFKAMTGPRFDGIDLSTQPMPEAAVDLISKTKIHYVHGTAVCDGNINGIRGGVQGHPKIYINTDKPGVHVCTYCGNRYAEEKFKAEIEAGELTDLHC